MRIMAWLAVGWALHGCTCSDAPPERLILDSTDDLLDAASAEPTQREPVTLYVPDAAPVVASGTPPLRGLVGGACPPEMVSVRGQFCIDRFEASLVDVDAERNVSPYFHPTFFHTNNARKVWETERHNMGAEEYRLLPIPEPPLFQLQRAFDVKAVARRGVTPNGYISGVVAERACKNSGKRLCTEEEWVTACRGEQDRQFPYGDEYRHRTCNVNTGNHPAAILHGHASKGHLDPRLNQFAHQGRSLLHETGENPECASRWGEDAIYDMVGNLDEWIEDEEGVFLGGFYARNTKDGCLSRISAHPRAYFDYSLGIRCCK